MGQGDKMNDLKENENIRHEQRLSRIKQMEDAGIYSKECADARRVDENRRHEKILTNFGLLEGP